MGTQIKKIPHGVDRRRGVGTQEAGRRLGGDKRLGRTPSSSPRRKRNDDGRRVSDNFDFVEVQRPSTPTTARRTPWAQPNTRASGRRDQACLANWLTTFTFYPSGYISTVIAVKLGSNVHLQLPS